VTSVNKTALEKILTNSFKGWTTYYVLIKSNKRQGISMTEVMGKIKCQKIILKVGHKANMSYNFGLR
jgi:hypothetical protein